MRARRSSRGFSIIELVVVSATIAILAAIAIPNLMHAFKRARVVEAVVTMQSIERALKEYYNAHDQYPAVAGAWNPVGDDQGKTGKRAMDPSLPGWNQLLFKPDGAYYYRYRFTPKADSEGKFTLVAIEATADTNRDGVPMHYLDVFERGVQVSSDDTHIDE